MTHVPIRRTLAFLVIAAVATAFALAVILRSTSTADAATSVSSRLTDFRISARPSSAESGRVTFNVRNGAQIDHELVVIKTSRQATRLPLRNGRASERGARGEVELGGGESRRLSLDLPSGHYVLICNIGRHYQAGMRTNFTVR